VNSEIPAHMNAIVMKCLSKPPAERYPRANDLADALIAAIAQLDGSPAALRAATTARRATPASK
jgi:hypothetical protein